MGGILRTVSSLQRLESALVTLGERRALHTLRGMEGVLRCLVQNNFSRWKEVREECLRKESVWRTFCHSGGDT